MFYLELKTTVKNAHSECELQRCPHEDSHSDTDNILLQKRLDILLSGVELEVFAAHIFAINCALWNCREICECSFSRRNGEMQYRGCFELIQL